MGNIQLKSSQLKSPKTLPHSQNPKDSSPQKKDAQKSITQYIGNKQLQHSNPINSSRQFNNKCQFVYLQPITLGQCFQYSLNSTCSNLFNIEQQIFYKQQVNQYNTYHFVNKLTQQKFINQKQLGLIKSNINHQITQSHEIMDMKNIDRIMVQWNRFVKIKNKNYLDDYVFIKEIGMGTFGVVAKIQMKYGGLFKAAKIIKMAMFDQKKNKKEKFMTEITISMKIDHPNINKLFEVYQWQDQYVLIMQLCEGGDLYSYIKSQKFLSESRIAQMMVQIMSGIVYLHKNSIVHRDLKPQNMLYDTESKLLKIIDFGSAIELPGSKQLTSVVGTPYYIAPEVLSGNYNQKCDIWSCGVILYMLLSGRTPFAGKNQQQIMNNIRNQQVSFMNPIWYKRSKQCKKLVLQMLNKDYNQRMSASDVLNCQWLVNAVKNYHDEELGMKILKNLNNFQFQNKLKAVVYTYIVSHLYSNKDKQKLLKYFREIDRNGDGMISREQILAVFRKHTEQNEMLIDIDKLIQKIDTNGSGTIDFTEFLVAASSQRKLVEKDRLDNAFQYLDGEHRGFITGEEIKQYLDNSDQTEKEIKKIFGEGNGKISKQQFINLLMIKQKQ